MRDPVGRALGGAVLVGLAVAGLGWPAVAATVGLAPDTPHWGVTVALGFPLVVGTVFVGYLWEARDHEHWGHLLEYAGTGGLLGAAVLVVPGLVIVLQQRAVGASIRNADVFLVELALGGAVVGLAAGHLYAVSRAERKRLERRETAVERHRQRLSVLNRVLRHDVRNHMNVVLGSVAQLPDEEVPREPLDRVRRHSRKILEISENVHHIESLTRGAPGPRATVNLVDTVRAVVAETQREHPAATLTVTTPEAAYVESAGHLQAAVENVVENAVEHNDADEPRVDVTVEVDEANQTVDLSVVDDGPGFPEQERTVFERGTETDLHHSDGLGLWVVRWIVDDADGRLQIENKADRGAVVTVRLPLARADGETESERGTNGADAPQSSRNAAGAAVGPDGAAVVGGDDTSK
ncbi:sensor histidine kinase [Halobaculum sp. MBLA0147]|uniref:sensor histidine kinase n=1 Tax=Halobaculum sp. MBLA0147 TaxID=3079934 RepID=UPI0035241E6E